MSAAVPPRTFLLIPRAWSGAWSWEAVRRVVEALGHRTRAMTLSGLSPEQVRRLAERMRPHPGRTVSEAASMTRPLAEQRATYVAGTLDGHGLHLVRDSDTCSSSPSTPVTGR